MSERRKVSRKPLSTNKYIEIHENYMAALKNAEIVCRSTLKWNFDERPVIELVGKVFVADKLCLNVNKTLVETKVNGRNKVKKHIYSYNLNIEGTKNSEIFRYDNFHEHDGHICADHLHRFDPPGRQILSSPFELEPDYVPTLDKVIEEAFRYAVAHKMRTMRKKQRDYLQESNPA